MDADTTIQRNYAAARLQLPLGTAITVLHIGEAATVLAVGRDAEPSAVLSLAIGSQKTAAAFFKHTPPTPGEIENAIMVVEDEVTLARHLVAGHTTLFSADAALLAMAAMVGIDTVHSRSMSLETVEGLFDLLAALSQGRPAATAGIPDTPHFAATLLILREFMHHLGFTEIRW